MGKRVGPVRPNRQDNRGTESGKRTGPPRLDGRDHNRSDQSILPIRLIRSVHFTGPTNRSSPRLGPTNRSSSLLIRRICRVHDQPGYSDEFMTNPTNPTNPTSALPVRPIRRAHYLSDQSIKCMSHPNIPPNPRPIRLVHYNKCSITRIRAPCPQRSTFLSLFFADPISPITTRIVVQYRSE